MIVCPRCKGERPTEEFYGPCEACVVELRATMFEAPRHVATAFRWSPSANVVPNHVATKD